MSTTAREGETIEGSRTMRNRPYSSIRHFFYSGGKKRKKKNGAAGAGRRPGRDGKGKGRNREEEGRSR